MDFILVDNFLFFKEFVMITYWIVHIFAVLTKPRKWKMPGGGKN